MSLVDTNTNAVIHYTTDRTVPTSSWPVFTSGSSSPFSVSGDGTTETITAMAVISGSRESSITQVTYTIHFPSAVPTFSEASGTYNGSQIVSLADISTGAVIHYTTDGIAPTATSPVVIPVTTAAIPVSGNGTVKAMNAIAVDPTGVRPNSSVASATYTVKYQYSLSLFGGSSGTVSPAGTQTLGALSGRSISATPTGANSFSQWMVTFGGGVLFANAKSASTTVCLTGNVTIEAILSTAQSIAPGAFQPAIAYPVGMSATASPTAVAVGTSTTTAYRTSPSWIMR